MKRIFLFTASLVTVLSASAQIPNASFESWSTTNGYAEPDNWATLNAMTTSMSVYTAEPGTPGIAGSSYLKLTSKNVTGMGVMPGIAATGSVDMSTMAVTGGFPYATRPASLTGSWQYMAMSGSDLGFIAVYLTKWNSSAMARDTVATALKPLTGMAMSWATFSIPLVYNKSFAPDSALIILSSSGMNPANGSYLWVDNLAFSGSGPTAITNTESIINKVAVYPNPAKNIINISFNTKQAGNYTVQITDITGKVVSTLTADMIRGSNQLPIDIHTLSMGTYSINLTNGTQSVTSKFIIQ